MGDSISTPELGPRYALGSDWAQERARLQLLEHAFDELTTSRFRTLGIAPGARCLEVGGGAGSIARWLCRQVGSRGQVTATDLDTTWLEQLDEPNLTVVRHDLTADEFPSGSFDFIHARAVLEHIADRDAVLDRASHWLAPGGWMYLDDYAFFPIDSATNPPYRNALHAAEALLAQTGTDYRWPRTFPEPLVRCGLVNPGAQIHVETVRGGSPIGEFLRLTLEYLRPRLLEQELIAETELDQACRSLQEPGFWELAPAHVAAWAQRPA